VARSFSYSRAAPFAAGAHRGVDFAAPPGTAVRAACGGRVMHAGRVAGPAAVISVRCGDRRVSYLPLASVAVRAGADLRAGAPLGVLAAGHGGLHVGVRIEADPFGYVDPLALLPPPGRPLPVAPRPPAPRPPAPRPPAPERRVPRSLPPRAPERHVPRPLPRPMLPVFSGRAPPRASPAPWPVWAGLAVLLSGAAGSGTVVVRRRRGRARATPARAEAAA
jgi:murein DD-endopeptidase MepM/ murein hydrolase activator NlpD